MKLKANNEGTNVVITVQTGNGEKDIIGDIEGATAFYDELGDAITRAQLAQREAEGVRQSLAGSDELTEAELAHEHRNLSSDELAKIGAGEIVAAIKSVRERTQRTLHQSKQIVDTFRDLLRGKKR